MSKKPLKNLVIHCTDTPLNREVTEEELRRWHCAPPPVGRGWRQVGYSSLVGVTGIIKTLVPNNGDSFVDAEEITNGAAGYNSESYHIAYAGGKGTPPINELQKTVLLTFVKSFIAQQPQVKVCGHYQLDKSKTCPNVNVPAWLRENGVGEQNIL